MREEKLWGKPQNFRPVGANPKPSECAGNAYLSTEPRCNCNNRLKMKNIYSVCENFRIHSASIFSVGGIMSKWRELKRVSIDFFNVKIFKSRVTSNPRDHPPTLKCVLSKIDGNHAKLHLHFPNFDFIFLAQTENPQAIPGQEGSSDFITHPKFLTTPPPYFIKFLRSKIDGNCEKLHFAPAPNFEFTPPNWKSWRNP